MFIQIQAVLPRNESRVLFLFGIEKYKCNCPPLTIFVGAPEWSIGFRGRSKPQGQTLLFRLVNAGPGIVAFVRYQWVPSLPEIGAGYCGSGGLNRLFLAGIHRVNMSPSP